MRKTLKILHTLAGGGLVGGLACYMLLLLAAPQDTPAAYADLRQSITLLGRYVLVPSLGVAIASGLFSMAVHYPFQEKGWVWVKAAMGFPMFAIVMTALGEKAGHAAALSQRIAEGEAVADALEKAVALEWRALAIVMAAAIANIVLGVWRPRRVLPSRQGAEQAPKHA